MTWQLLAGILGGIVLIGNAGAVIFKWLKPAFELTKDVSAAKKDIELLKQHEKNDFQKLNEIEKMNKAQCSAMLSMMNHMIDGNHVDKMRETRDEIQDMLINM